MSFDPETKAFKVYEIGEDALYPHTIRIDPKGIVWFTIAVSNQVGRFDPATETFTLLQLPHNGFWRWVADVFFPTLLKYSARSPRENKHVDLSAHKMMSGVEYDDLFNLPYGIDINPKDGKVCSSSSNLPAYAIEDGLPSFICVDPVGADKDRARANSANREH
jgi:virginiamycin B lyase